MLKKHGHHLLVFTILLFSHYAFAWGITMDQKVSALKTWQNKLASMKKTLEALPKDEKTHEVLLAYHAKIDASRKDLLTSWLTPLPENPVDTPAKNTKALDFKTISYLFGWLSPEQKLLQGTDIQAAQKILINYLEQSTQGIEAFFTVFPYPQKGEKEKFEKYLKSIYDAAKRLLGEDTQEQTQATLGYFLTVSRKLPNMTQPNIKKNVASLLAEAANTTEKKKILARITLAFAKATGFGFLSYSIKMPLHNPQAFKAVCTIFLHLLLSEHIKVKIDPKKPTP